MSELELPRMLGRYRLDGVLGRGAMGVVYKAHDPVIDRVIAIKVVRTDLLDGDGAEEYMSRFRREAQAAGRCTHPNIVAVYDYSEGDGTAFIAMEYVQGRELQDFLRQNVRFEPKEVLLILLQVLNALGYAHGLGIVHRDIKPANVILLDGGRVKVADFGVARLDSTNLTQHGSIVGTPSYMSPEQFKGETVDHRADLFSAGVILYELLAGEKPFPGRNATEVMYKLLNHEPRDIAEANAALPPALNIVLRRALAKRSEDRFQSAQDFADALNAAFTGAAQQQNQAYPDQTVLMPQAQTIVGMGGPAGGWDAKFLQEVEKDLAYHVGPVAKVLVKNAAEKTSNVVELYETLSRKIPNDLDRSQFMKKAWREQGGSSGLRSRGGGTGFATGASSGMTAGMIPGMTPGTGSFGGSSSSRLSPEVIEAAQTALTFHVGPIAKVLVKKAASQAASTEDLYNRLATHITRDEDRATFLRTRPRG
jgi:eukaryotic-like serine/threonine-protein kinase